MRQAIKNVAFTLLLVSAWPASASTMVSTVTTQVCSACPNGTGALQAFDSNLGTLTGITLAVDAHLQDAMNFTNSLAPESVPGTIDLTSDGPFSVSVNGAIYSFEVSGSNHYLYSGTGSLFADAFAAGSATFVLDPSIFPSFVGTSNSCGGICANSLTFPIPNLQIQVSDSHLHLSLFDALVTTQFTLTYTYNSPGEVPEPATWAMMLLGFGGIGMAMRRQRRNRLAQVA